MRLINRWIIRPQQCANLNIGFYSHTQSASTQQSKRSTSAATPPLTTTFSRCLLCYWGSSIVVSPNQRKTYWSQYTSTTSGLKGFPGQYSWSGKGTIIVSVDRVIASKLSLLLVAVILTASTCVLLMWFCDEGLTLYDTHRSFVTQRPREERKRRRRMKWFVREERKEELTIQKTIESQTKKDHRTEMIPRV